MPEGPELAYSRDVLKTLIEGKAACSLRVGPSGRYTEEPPVGLQDFLDESKRTGSPRVKEVATHGKFMWWELASSTSSRVYFHSHFGMSGGWFTSPSKHTAFSVTYNDTGLDVFRDTQTVFFNDPRHFGTLKFVRGTSAHAS